LPVRLLDVSALTRVRWAVSLLSWTLLIGPPLLWLLRNSYSFLDPSGGASVGIICSLIPTAIDVLILIALFALTVPIRFPKELAALDLLRRTVRVLTAAGAVRQAGLLVWSAVAAPELSSSEVAFGPIHTIQLIPAAYVLMGFLYVRRLCRALRFDRLESTLLWAGLACCVFYLMKDFGAAALVAGRWPGIYWLCGVPSRIAKIVIWAYSLYLARRFGAKLQAVLAGHCVHCGYDLTGNVSGTCPECGCTIGSRGRKGSRSGATRGNATRDERP
jgi:hypothetical protein